MMLRAYRALLRLYPHHVRVLYGEEMIAEFVRRRGSRAATAGLLLRELLRLLPDAAAERIATVSSHPSFRGRCLPNPGVVRPPNVGKREWFFSEEIAQDTADPKGSGSARHLDAR